MMNKKFWWCILVSCLSVSFLCTTAFADTWKQYLPDGTPYTVTDDYIIVNGRALIKLRDFITNFTGEDEVSVAFNKDTKTASIIIKDTMKIIITAGQNNFEVLYLNNHFLSGKKDIIELDSAAEIINGHFYLPARKVGEIYGLDFEWDAGSKLIYIYS